MYTKTNVNIVVVQMQVGSGGGRVVKRLACGARDPIPDLATWISEIGYLLLLSRNMAEIPLKRRKSSIQPTNHSVQVLYTVNTQFTWPELHL